MSDITLGSRFALRAMRQTRALEAGIAALKPDFAMSKVMETTGALLALPDDKLRDVLDDLKLTASRMNKRIDSMEARQ